MSSGWRTTSRATRTPGTAGPAAGGGLVVDHNLPLPHPTAVIEGRASRRDVYPVVVATTLERSVDALCGMLIHPTVALVSDDTVDALYGDAVTGALTRRGVVVHRTCIPAGERSKNIDVAVRLLDWLAATNVGRRDLVVSLGGGVVIDTVGWVASAFMRGLPYVNMPTTLLAGVDAAIGGKVAVDHPTAKNLIGAFYQPVGVVSNIEFLSTLDRRQVRAGLAEAIKKGAIASPELFAFIDTELDALLERHPAALEALVRSASAVKCRLVERDPYERDLRRPLNFGHTAGHALETVTGYGPVLHGEAVAFGMAVATRVALRRGQCDEDFAADLVGLLVRAGLPVTLGDLPVRVDVDALVAALDKVRLIRDGRLRFVLPERLGRTVVVDDVTDAEVRRAVLSPI